jgi:hypothetical protein
LNELTDLLQRIIGLLDRAGIGHMVAGSFASTYHGAVRMTQDLDLVIDADAPSLETFVRSLPEDTYYVSEEAARDALRRRSMFNVVDMTTGWKVDFILRKVRPFSIEEFRRRKPARLFDVDVFVASPEDTILTKLEWASMSGSERQMGDVAGILAAKGNDIDEAYVERWAAELGVLDLWRKVKG